MANKDLIERAKYDPLRPKEVEPVSDALETFPYGLYIVGSRSAQGVLNGMMADWLMQVSFKPRLVACSLENDATTREPQRVGPVLDRRQEAPAADQECREGRNRIARAGGEDHAPGAGVRAVAHLDGDPFKRFRSRGVVPEFHELRAGVFSRRIVENFVENER